MYNAYMIYIAIHYNAYIALLCFSMSLFCRLRFAEKLYQKTGPVALFLQPRQKSVAHHVTFLL